MNNPAEQNEELKAAYQTDFIKMMGVVLVRCSDGECIVELPVKEKHKQHRGSVHGGVLAALIDHSGASAALSLLDQNSFAVTADLNVSYLKPALSSKIRFHAKVLKRGRVLSVVEVKVYNLEPEVSMCAVGRLSMSILTSPDTE